MKAEIGDEARERGWDLDLELVPWKNRVLKGFKKGKGDPIHVLERLLWHLVEGGWKGPDRGKETHEAVAVTRVTQSHGRGGGRGQVGRDRRLV